MLVLDVDTLRRAVIEDQMQQPVPYSWWVWALAVALLVLIVAWYLWVAWWTRTRPEAAVEHVPQITPSELAANRAAYGARIEAAHAAYVAGDTDVRALYLEMNRIIRDFATLRTGVDAKPLTASELLRLRKGDLVAGVVALQNEPAFAAHSGPDVDAGVARAKEIISSW